MFWSLLRGFRLVLNFFANLVYFLIYEGKKSSKIPPIGDDLLLIPANVLAEKIRTGKVSSVQVVKSYIKRIKEVNHVINCMVDQRFDEALQEANEADIFVRSTSNLEQLKRDKPFLGVPFTAKDCFAITGLSYTSGLAERGERNVKADFDADAVTLMRKAGGISLAVTNVPELCMWMESYNKVYGRSNNPYHPGRTVGGSSGGEGGLIASAGSLIGIGSDVGGSIRIPAFFCGIFGHKPSPGLVSNVGMYPEVVGSHNNYYVTGTLCRYATDLLPMFEVLLKENVRKSNQLRLREKIDLSKIRLFYVDEDGDVSFSFPVHKELKDVQERLVQSLSKAHGMAEPKKVSIKLLNYSFQIWTHKLYAEKSGASACKALTDLRSEMNPFVELAKWILLKSTKHTLPAIGLGLFEKFFSGRDHSEFIEKCDELREELEALLGDDGVLVFPPYISPAPYHGQAMFKAMTLAFNIGHTCIFNVTGNPVTQVPLGLGSWGVPLGMQLICARNQDRLGLALATEVEKLFGGWVPPTGIAK